MGGKARTPAPKNLSRAGKDMHSTSKKVRQEAAEVLALATRRTAPKPTRKG